jgi:nitrite reductase/ring-hydroxylating ferredoxin subunit
LGVSTTCGGWECLAKREQVGAGSPLSLDSGDSGIGVYEVDGELYALEDTCPHGPSLLSRGYTRENMVMCPLHGAIFDVKTGKCLRGPAERDLRTYPVIVKDDDVFIQIVSEESVE